MNAPKPMKIRVEVALRIGGWRDSARFIQSRKSWQEEFCSRDTARRLCWPFTSAPSL